MIWRYRTRGRRHPTPMRAPVLDADSLNMHFAYEDEDAHTRHEVWYLDASDGAE